MEPILFLSLICLGQLNTYCVYRVHLELGHNLVKSIETEYYFCCRDFFPMTIFPMFIFPFVIFPMDIFPTR